jgi:hypothetical protein
MNVNNNLFANINTSSLTSAGNVGATPSTPSSIPPPMGGAASTSISTPGQFFSEMQQLSQQNPSEFKTVAAQVATSFQNAASQTSGPQAQFLSNLANQFTQAAQTGTLQAPEGAQAAQSGQSAQVAQGGPSSGSAGMHHHHHHGGGGSMSQSSSVQQAFQSAMQILEQATGSTSTSESSTSTST